MKWKQETREKRLSEARSRTGETKNYSIFWINSTSLLHHFGNFSQRSCTWSQKGPSTSSETKPARKRTEETKQARTRSRRFLTKWKYSKTEDRLRSVCQADIIRIIIITLPEALVSVSPSLLPPSIFNAFPISLKLHTCICAVCQELKKKKKLTTSLAVRRGACIVELNSIFISYTVTFEVTILLILPDRQFSHHWDRNYKCQMRASVHMPCSHHLPFRPVNWWIRLDGRLKCLQRNFCYHDNWSKSARPIFHLGSLQREKFTALCPTFRAKLREYKKGLWLVAIWKSYLFEQAGDAHVKREVFIRVYRWATEH